MRERSSGSDNLESPGSTFAGRPASFCSQYEGSSKAGMMYSESTPSFFAAPSANRSASAIFAGAWSLDPCDQVGILPDRNAVLAPVKSKRPARQAFARIPFALPEMQQSARRETGPQPADQVVRQPALVRTDRGNIPFRRFKIVDGNKGRLAAHRQPDVAGLEIGIDLLAQPVQPRPGLIGERLGNARRFANSLHAHVEGEIRHWQTRPRR